MSRLLNCELMVFWDNIISLFATTTIFEIEARTQSIWERVRFFITASPATSVGVGFGEELNTRVSGPLHPKPATSTEHKMSAHKPAPRMPLQTLTEGFLKVLVLATVFVLITRIDSISFWENATVSFLKIEGGAPDRILGIAKSTDVRGTL